MKMTSHLAVIVPVTERFDSVKDLYFDYRAALETTGFGYEFTYVLDGDFPDVYDGLKQLRETGEPLNIVQLARGFGEATALTAGFQCTSESVILVLPAYYQVDVEALRRITSLLKTCDMVIARRWPRIDSWFNRFQTRLFHALVRVLTGSSFRDLGCGVRAFAREVVDEIPLYGDQHRFLPLLAEQHGFRVREVDLPQSPRERTRRVYRIGVYPRRMLDLLTVLFLTKFTKKPLRFFGLIGIAVFSLGALFTIYLVIERLAFGVGLADRPALLLSSLLLVLGVQVFALGLVGELIIFTHARNIKEYSIREAIGFNGDTKLMDTTAVRRKAVREA